MEITEELGKDLLTEMKAINIKFDKMIVLLKHLVDKME